MTVAIKYDQGWLTRARINTRMVARIRLKLSRLGTLFIKGYSFTYHSSIGQFAATGPTALDKGLDNKYYYMQFGHPCIANAAEKMSQHLLAQATRAGTSPRPYPIRIRASGVAG